MGRRIQIGFLTSLGSLLLVSGAMAASYSLEANLDGLQEVPPNASPAFGQADATIDDTTGAFAITIGTYSDLLGNSTVVTLSDAAVGANGPTLLNLTLDTPGATTGTFSGSGTLTVGQIADVIAGNTYINVRSNVFPSGEIRGQLLVPEPASLGVIGFASVALIRRRRRLV